VSVIIESATFLAKIYIQLYLNIEVYILVIVWFSPKKQMIIRKFEIKLSTSISKIRGHLDNFNGLYHFSKNINALESVIFFSKVFKHIKNESQEN